MTMPDECQRCGKELVKRGFICEKCRKEQDEKVKEFRRKYGLSKYRDKS